MDFSLPYASYVSVLTNVNRVTEQYEIEATLQSLIVFSKKEGVVMPYVVVNDDLSFG